MINDIIKGIAIAIKNEFEENHSIYTEKVEQGFKPPCFYIKCISPVRKKISIARYHSINKFDIHFFPDTNKVQTECHNTAEKLCNCLEQIQLFDESVLLADSPSSSITDDVLHFLVNFDCVLKDIEEEKDMMQTVETIIKET